jgi:hypothetical protein
MGYVSQEALTGIADPTLVKLAGAINLPNEAGLARGSTMDAVESG